ncbi:hypothetical protein F5888DRAFT_1659857 [Russula emetica]|nr:hypothetical protein F5888DRAFT_1659857 [Russula emetica]
MPKRIKTPPPPEDEPRYLVVVHPYPLNANLLLHTDRRALALWLACCIGKDALYAMYYKPSSPGMVIIEVDHYFDRFDSLLGKHHWSSFLRNPTKEDGDKVSKVFWCLYNSGRLVQKNGWKRVDVEEHWFQGWTPDNNTIKHPYPKTTYCDVPAEAQTGVPLCRPLPKDTFTPPPPKPRPTVGSAEWILSRSRSSNASSEAPSSSRRRRQIAPSDSASVISSPSAYGARGPPPQAAYVSRWLDDIDAKQLPWPRPPSTISSTFTLSSSITSSSVGSRTPSALGATPAAATPPSRPSVPARPPGLDAQSGPSFRPYESFDWTDEIEIEAQQDVPTSPQSGSTSRAPGGHTPRRAPEPKGAVDPDQNYEYEEEDVPKRSTADAMKAIFDGAPGVPASGLELPSGCPSRLDP